MIQQASYMRSKLWTHFGATVMLSLEPAFE